MKLTGNIAKKMEKKRQKLAGKIQKIVKIDSKNFKNLQLKFQKWKKLTAKFQRKMGKKDGKNCKKMTAKIE